MRRPFFAACLLICNATGTLPKRSAIELLLGEVEIFPAVLALATDEPPLSVASAKTPGVAKAYFQKIIAQERLSFFWKLASLRQRWVHVTLVDFDQLRTAGLTLRGNSARYSK